MWPTRSELDDYRALPRKIRAWAARPAPVRVLLAPLETAGVAGALRDGLRARGHDAELWTIAEHPFVRTQDRLVRGYRARARAALRAPLRFDVLHYQFGTTLAEFLDAAWARVPARRLALMHYWGDDCRIRTGAACARRARRRTGIASSGAPASGSSAAGCASRGGSAPPRSSPTSSSPATCGRTSARSTSCPRR